MTTIKQEQPHMLNQHDYVDLEYLHPEEEGIQDLFPSEDEAIFALYEQLFCNMNTVCKETILNSMKYLIFKKNMDNQMEEIRHMMPCDVDVVHHREIEKEIEQATKEMKKELYDILEDKLFDKLR